MRTLCYSQLDARQWAAFSGDYNPVHFDKAWVKARGGNQLSVHGMRAALDVKRFISPMATSAPFLKCTVRFRRPLWRDTAYLMMRDVNKRDAAFVRDLSAKEHYLSCQIAPVNLFAIEHEKSQRELGASTIVALHQTFLPLLPDARQWHFLDALLFRHLLQDSALLRQQAIAAILPVCHSLDMLFSRFHVVQTHQEVIFDSHLLEPWSTEPFSESLEIETLPAVVVGDLVNGAAVRIAARTHYQQRYISSAVTLKIGALTKGK
ncbi:protein dehydratase [Enterobacter cloacae complex sp. P40RS]|uniref:Protein dehydratase n=2 Tax=Enterobacter cloacae complex TaxID=354276 RepID=A0A7H8U9Z5_ENTCL|nr:MULTISPECIES: MaoC/PaaZ C-terminal domain-containing protein [Enterobacter cloacae complex]MBE4854625.1 protein dehydratase [Enterobacter pasteurii]MBE4862897.1 protein dehydratase [Enterobacter cloacae complex sp. P40C2]MBE4876601.1 protein dehydratase [Enterobacter cloacae complex sp. P40C]MDE4082610.1 MaoC/PaaZ C-terminal domain-containing protein [Enterobacter pasteurii]QKZ96718.1 protein dehydratase [Enterobacter cloacae]